MSVQAGLIIAATFVGWNEHMRAGVRNDGYKCFPDKHFPELAGLTFGYRALIVKLANECGEPASTGDRFSPAEFPRTGFTSRSRNITQRLHEV